MKKLIQFIVFLLCISSFAQTNDSLPKFSMKSINESESYFTKLHGWKFQQGTNDEWKNSDFNDNSWTIIKTDTFGNTIKTKINFDKIGWFRNSFVVDSTIVGVPLGFSVNLSGAYSIYLDGKLLKTFGKFSSENNAKVGVFTINELNTPYIDFVFENPGKHTFAIKYENDEIKTTDSFFDFEFKITKIGNALGNTQSKNMTSSVIMIIGMVFLTLSVFHLILFLFYREFKPNLFFSLFSFSMAGIFIGLSSIFMVSNVMYEDVLNKFVIFLVCLAGFALSGLVNKLFSKDKRRFKVFSILSAVAVVILFFSIDVSGFMVPFLFFFACIESTVLLIKAILKKVKGARILASGIFLTIFFFVLAIIVFMIFSKNGTLKLGNAQSETVNILLVIVFFGFILSIFSIPFSMSAYLAWYFSYINKENEEKLLEVEELNAHHLHQEKEKLVIIENINQELETQVENRKKEIEIQKNEIEIQNGKLDVERLKSEQLLLNILPEEIALELKEKGKTQSKFFDSVTILFTDFKDFTKLTEKVSSTELIEELNYCFKEFDRIISKYGIEKIKTIGDAYMAVSGLPAKDEKHAVKMVYAALEIRDFMETYKQKRIAEGKEYFEMRIGINSGEVVAGIVGIKKFAYDVWGSAVNIAAEMEVHGAIGKVNISENTQKLIKNIFDTELRPEKLQDSQVNMYFAEYKQPSVNFKKVQQFIVEKQINELPKHLHYHNINHILDVHDAVIRYARLEGIDSKNTELLQVAALFHDSGFIVQAEGHEEISCDFAAQYLPDFGYSTNEIEKIKGMIRATKIPQSPTSHLEQIIADADLDYLGRTDFEEISNGLFEELKAENKIADVDTWNNIQVSFFEKHNYFTESAKRLRNDKKQQNLETIKKQIS
ncbi:adenylate/guanylate cyclase domain-containing protein [Paenimyroides aestuarii]|uniref:HD domain-containing protein n=1 Tax=Paenimyroides aestuarii TaxID=2968490 RepID=A0ABY5NSL4_9FLAO|nr:adenylate/guanylate cyclase domain-containing protein [Paenimyroides aestuarii]UUV21551.1 HD domain-containing protein [Paenimyroides aestuarii]